MEVDEGLDIVSLRNSMLDHLSLNNEAHFKSQQLNEPDLTSLEKRKIAQDILETNPGCFLSRFGAFLNENHLDYFNEMASENYEVNYYITDLRKNFQKTFSKSVVRNRRLEALRRLTVSGEYFTDDEMRKRNPALYEHLVGQYMTDEEKMSILAEKNECSSFTSILLNAIDEKEIQDRLKTERVSGEEESDSSYVGCEGESSSEEEFQMQQGASWGEFTQPSIEQAAITQPAIAQAAILQPAISQLAIPANRRRRRKSSKRLEALSEDEKEIMMNEFRSQMFSEFLGGYDSEFDYSTVDANKDFDDLDMLEIDQQDKYFDSEPPQLLPRGKESSDSSKSASIQPPRNLVQKMADLET